MLAFCLVLMWKRRSIERLVRLLDERMPQKNLLAARTFDEQLEDGLSFVLFFKVACDMVDIIIYVCLGLPQFSSRVIRSSTRFTLCVGQCSSVALNLRRLSAGAGGGQVDRIHRMLRLLASQVSRTLPMKANPLPQEVESSTASSSASSRAESPFARCSKCPTLASSYVVLPVLLWNEGLVHSKGPKQY